MYIPDPKNGSGIFARHGFQGQLAQLGASNDARQGQGVYSTRQLNGTLRRFCFGGGRMYEWDGLTTFTDITPVGVTIDSTNPVFCALLNGELLVSDENNKPWIYTLETGAVETIKYNDLDEEWNTKGGIVIYSGYPVAIVKSVGQVTLAAENLDTLTTESGIDLTTEPLEGFRNTIAWGDAFTARTGWNQLDVDHTWQLTQTSGELLGCLFAEEGKLVYLRTEGMGYISGPVVAGDGSQWRGSSTRDAIDALTGTDAPAAFIAVDDKYFFLDVEGRPQMMSRSGKPVGLWLPIRREVEQHFGTQMNRSNVVTYGRVGYHKEYDVVLFTIWDRTTLYAYNAKTGNYLGTWQVAGGIHITMLGRLPDAYERDTFIILGSRGLVYDQAQMGVFWKQKHPDDASQWLDQADASQAVHTSFTRAIETHWLKHKIAKSYRLTRVVTDMLGDAAQHSIRLLYKTPTAAQSVARVALSSATVGGKTSEDSISNAAWSLGRNAQGSGIRLRLEATHADNVRFGVHQLLAQAIVKELRPKAA
jgi:hypothetical protein